MQKKMKPSVFDFLDAAQFLQSHYDWRKSLHPQFSITAWSEELGLGSKVTLRFILKRMRSISPRSALIFKNQLFQNQVEDQCFDALVAYSQAKTVSQRHAFGAALLDIHKKRLSYKPIDAQIAAKNNFGPMVLTLMTFADFKKNSGNLAQLLKVDQKSIENILKEFEKDKIITKDKDGEYHFDAEVFKISDNSGLRNFYEYWIERSKEALDLPSDTRKYRSLNFALTPSEYAQALEKLNEYALGLLSKFNAKGLGGRQLYMYESCLFPVSEALQQMEPETSP